MSSPFTFFRRNQHVWMVAVVILSMMAFTLDAVFSQEGSHFVMLGVLLGGIILAFAGVSSGRWMQYGIAGAVLGGVSGFVLPDLISPANAVIRTSTLGTFDERRIGDLMLKRNVANGFLFQAFEKTIGPGMGRFAPQFQFYSGNVEDDMTFGELMRAEADELQIVVTDRMVFDYINKRTDNKLTKAMFAEIRNGLSFNGKVVTEAELVDAFRNEVKAQMAYQHLNPHFSAVPQGPEVYYELYKRTKISQRLNAVRLDVDAFTSEVPDPSDAEIGKLFAENRLKFPHMDEPGSPGFRQPQKAKLAYLELGYKAVEQATTAPTDAEIEAYYNENKERLYKKPVEVEEEKTDSATPPAEGGTAPEGEAKPEGEAPKENPAPAEPSADAPKPEEAKPEEAKPEEAKPEEAKPETPAAEPPAAEAPKAEAPKEEPKPEEPKPEAPADQCLPFADEAKPEEPAPAAEPAKQDAPAPAATETPAAPAAADEKPAAPAAETPAAETPAAPAAETPATTEEAKPAAEAATESTTEDSTKPDFVIPKVEYQPLDDDLKSEIRDQLLDQKVRTSLDEKMLAVMKDLKALQARRASVRRAIVTENRDISDEDLYEKMRDQAKVMIDGMKELATQHGCSFVETPLITFQDLAEGETYPIGAATEPQQNPFMQAGATVAQQVFGMFPKTIADDTNLFVRTQSVKNAFDLDGGEVHFAWWIVEFADTHVPKLEDPGIKDQVVQAWKRIKARDLVKKRAEELVKLVNEGLAKPEGERKDMAASIEGQTVLGKADSAALTLRQTQSFSWMEQSITPQMNFMQQRPTLRRSEVRFNDEVGGSIRFAGDKFMKTVFEEIENDQVGIVSTEDLSTFYVVQPVERSADDEVLRQQFMTEGKQAGFDGTAVQQMLNASVSNPASIAWERSIWTKYGIDRDSLPEE
jgi:hypothetical protein